MGGDPFGVSFRRDFRTHDGTITVEVSGERGERIDLMVTLPTGVKVMCHFDKQTDELTSVPESLPDHVRAVALATVDEFEAGRRAQGEGSSARFR